MTTSPEFNDGSAEQARQAPSQTQSQDPTGAPVQAYQDPSQEPSQYEEFLAWKRQQAATDFGPDERKADVVSTGRKVPTETSKSEAPAPKVEEDVIPQSYVWLANGEIVKANDEDLPGHAGAGNPHGFWQKDGKVHTIVGVYPVELNAEGN
jgi:hypothetical protein